MSIKELTEVLHKTMIEQLEKQGLVVVEKVKLEKINDMVNDLRNEAAEVGPVKQVSKKKKTVSLAVRKHGIRKSAKTKEELQKEQNVKQSARMKEVWKERKEKIEKEQSTGIPEMTERGKAILKAIQDGHERFKDIVEASEVPYNSITKEIHELLKAGEIKKIGFGRYKPITVPTVKKKQGDFENDSENVREAIDAGNEE